MTKKSSSTPFAAADSTISVEIIVAAGCLHHIVGGSHVALVVFTVSVSVENQNSILSAVVATVVILIDDVAGVAVEGAGVPPVADPLVGKVAVIFGAGTRLRPPREWTKRSREGAISD